MAPDGNGTFVQLREDVCSSMQMVVVTVVPSGDHRVAVYTV